MFQKPDLSIKFMKKLRSLEKLKDFIRLKDLKESKVVLTGYFKKQTGAQKHNDYSTNKNAKDNSNINKFLNQYNIKQKIQLKTHSSTLFVPASVLISSHSDVISVTQHPDEIIPEPPAIPIPDVSEQVITQLNALGEPTLASLGLGGWTPVGIVQNCIEYLHASLGLPWWEAIVVGTIIVRCLLFPVVVIAQRNAARMNNYMPQMQVLQLKMTEARQTGNQIDAARYGQEMVLFMKEKGLNPLKNMLVPLAQAPIFISIFIGLRKMANVPVDSLRDGGIYWFKDLTVPDEFFILPLITSLTLWLTIEMGTEAGKLSSQNLQTMRYVFRALPLIIFPFTINFPGAILCYWVATNTISLVQVGFLRIPAVRDYFKIEPLISHKPENMPIKSKGFVGGVKDSWTNMKLTRELDERRQMDEMQFKRAGKGPIIRTYKYDPTKQLEGDDKIEAKKL